VRAKEGRFSNRLFDLRFRRLRKQRSLIIELTKHKDGSAVLRCIRGDGSVTWQKEEGTNAGFFPLRDLTHYAVETELGFRRGFYGLIAEGWEIAGTTGKTPRGALPAVGLLVPKLLLGDAIVFEAQLRHR
jgi:hypothetical protein